METENTTHVNELPLREITIGALYKHYSGKQYKVLAIAYDSENPAHKYDNIDILPITILNIYKKIKA